MRQHLKTLIRDKGSCDQMDCQLCPIRVNKCEGMWDREDIDQEENFKLALEKYEDLFGTDRILDDFV